MQELKVKAQVLVVDDDLAVATVLGALLKQAGHGFHHAASGEQALTLLRKHPFELLVSDVRMPGMDGISLLKQVREEWPGLPVVMLTAHGTVSEAVAAMRLGASDYLTKPFDRDELLFTLNKVLEVSKRELESPPNVPQLGHFWVGQSDAMRDVEALVRKAATSQATVLIRGETGTGKEVVARAIHEQSSRQKGPFVAVHCAALAESLLESELFGYEKGAFTGAVSSRPGRVELAEGGTLFFDEIGDISASTQVKLLRLLQEKQYERVGGVTSKKADVRFLAATHRDLENRVKQGQFREDLFYRLNVIPLWMPPLSQRPGDILLLAKHFVSLAGKANGKLQSSLTDDALSLLSQQSWPGNVRQLQNFIERLVVLSDAEVIGRSDVERELRRVPLLVQEAPASSPLPPQTLEGTLDKQRRDVEKEALLHALAKAHDNRSQAARLLGVSRRTLYNKLSEYGLG